MIDDIFCAEILVVEVFFGNCQDPYENVTLLSYRNFGPDRPTKIKYIFKFFVGKGPLT